MQQMRSARIQSNNSGFQQEGGKFATTSSNPAESQVNNSGNFGQLAGPRNFVKEARARSRSRSEERKQESVVGNAVSQVQSAFGELFKTPAQQVDNMTDQDLLKLMNEKKQKAAEKQQELQRLIKSQENDYIQNPDAKIVKDGGLPQVN